MTHPLVVPLGAAENAVRSFREAGGVVEYVLVAPSEDDPEARHRSAAIVALEEIADRFEHCAEAWSSEAGLDRKLYGTIVSHPDRAAGRPIDLHSLLGRAFDWESHRIVSMWREGPSGTGSLMAAGEFTIDGYAEAFSNPPYPMRADLDRLKHWFDAINRQLIGGLDDQLLIWSWSTDWSTWFDDGLEWWGSFLWTVERAGLPWLTAIAASATD